MKNISLYLLFISGLFAMNACHKDDSVDFLSKPTPASIAGPANKGTVDNAVQAEALSWQGCADFTANNTTICFVDANEYRCPCDVNCVWEGSVEYKLTVKSENRETTITLQPPGNPNNAPSKAVVGNSVISIEESVPMDCADYGNYEKYQIKVMVSPTEMVNNTF